ncbi:MAG: acetyl-CoA carboxylase biotin carboxyl carrier protein [Chamaesiphon sp.]
MAIDFNQLSELLAAIAANDIAELTLKSADFELTVRKGMPVMPNSSLPNGAHGVSAPSQIVPVVPAPEISVTSTAAPTSGDKKWVEVKSPMVGTFYRSPAPDEPPFVEVGDRIRVNQTVCIIEAMKLMNEIEAELSGQVIEILLENGVPVEYGQALMRVNPD